jgi:hypothetical protein
LFVECDKQLLVALLFEQLVALRVVLVSPEGHSAHWRSCVAVPARVT